MQREISDKMSVEENLKEQLNKIDWKVTDQEETTWGEEIDEGMGVGATQKKIDAEGQVWLRHIAYQVDVDG